ncbi:hypothetical protein ABIA99_005936 [Bradyrhizobium sp. LB12.1]
MYREALEDALEFSTAIEHDRLLPLRRRPNFIIGDDRCAARGIFVKAINPPSEANSGLPDWDRRECKLRVRPISRLAKRKLCPARAARFTECIPESSQCPLAGHLDCMTPEKARRNGPGDRPAFGEASRFSLQGDVNLVDILRCAIP